MKNNHIIRAAATLIFALSGAAALAGPNEYIDIRTRNSQMILGSNPKGELLFLHYGAPCGDPAQFDSYNSYRRSDYGTEPLALPARGGRLFNEPALAVQYADSDCNTELKYISHTEKQLGEGVCRHEVLLRDPKTLLEATLIYTAYFEEDVIAASTVIRNAGRKPVFLDSYASSSINIFSEKYMLTHFYGSWAREMQVDREFLTHGSKVIENRMGASTTHTENPSFILNLGDYSERDGEAIGGALAWTGNYRINFKVDESDRLSIIAGINPSASRYPLGKGEELDTPQMLWTYSLRGAGQVSRNFHDWARNHGSYGHGRLCPTLLNSWEGAYFKFDTKTLTDMIDDAASMGLELFVLDDGWFGNKYPRNNDKQGLGDWEVNVEKLPEGIGYLADYAHSKGLKFGIWIEPEMVNPKSELAEKHPDWILMRQNREPYYFRDQWVLDLTNPKVQDFVYGVVDDLMTENPNLKFFKWDCNSPITNIFSQHLGENQGNLYIDYVRGLYKVLDRVQAKYPDLYMMLCSGGGGRCDYEALKYFTEFWCSDNTDPVERLYIQWGFSQFLPSKAMCSHVTNWNKRASVKFRVDVDFTCKLGFDIDLKNMAKEDLEYCRQTVREYNRLKPVIYSPNLYRLVSPYETKHCVLERVSDDKSHALIAAYDIHPDFNEQLLPVRLEGLDANSKYRVKEICLMPEKESQMPFHDKVFSGDYLMKIGLKLLTGDDMTSRIIELTKE